MLQAQSFRRVCLLFISVVVWGVWAVDVQAAEITVNSTESSVAADGNCTLREAILAANNDAVEDGCAAGSGADVIILGENLIYTFDAEYDDGTGGTALPSITSNITVEGNGATIQRNPAYLTCDTARFRLFDIMINGTAALHDLTLKNGCADQGGAIYNLGVLTLVDTKILANQAGAGGGIYSGEKSILEIIRGTIAQNQADYGGGVQNQSSTATIHETQFLDNRAYDGAGMLNSSSAVTVANSTFLANTADAGGGGVWNGESQVQISNTQLFENKAPYGGGIAVHNYSNVTVVDSAILSNTAESGGGIGGSESTIILNHSQINSNLATLHGGGIYDFDGHALVISDTAVSFNRARHGNGGGIHSSSDKGMVTLENSTVLSNTAQNEGGGLRVHSSDMKIINSDIRHNRAEQGGGMFSSGRRELEIFTSEIVSNYAQYAGGGLADVDGIVAISESEISNNEAEFGGGIYIVGESTATISRTYILSNTTHAISWGGGIYTEGVVTLNNSHVRGNVATHGGGAYATASGRAGHFGILALFDTIFAANHATVDGGSIYGWGSKLTVVGSQIVSSIADRDGAGLFGSASIVDITDSQFTLNAATVDGGGLYIWDSTAVITDSHILTNTAANGGGIYSGNNEALGTQTVITIHNSDISANRVSGRGGGISAGVSRNSVSTFVTITDSRITRNSAGNGGGVSAAGGTVKISGSAILLNTATSSGAGISSIAAAGNSSGTMSTSVSQSCIVGNQAIGISDDVVGGTEATHNWWGEVDGPSGVGPGRGDSITQNITFEPFLTAPVLGCPFLADLDLPDVDPPDTDPPGTDPPDTDPPGTDPPGTNPPGTNPPGPDLLDVELYFPQVANK